MKARSNYREPEDLTQEEMSTLDHLERMVKSNEELGFAAPNHRRNEFFQRRDDFEKQLEAYKKEIGLA